MKDNDEIKYRIVLKNLYTSYKIPVYNFILKMIGDPVTAEDIVHDTFISVFENYDKFRSESTIQTWIFTIAKNHCLKYFNKLKHGTFNDIENLVNTAADTDSVDQLSDILKRDYIRQVKEGCLLGLLRCLSYYQRISFILHILNGFSVAETGEIVGKSLNATRILIHRARRNLKGFLCKNCSLYAVRNPCKCENLVSFSLKQGWIYDRKNSISSSHVEHELKVFGSEIKLYRSLNNVELPGRVAERIEKTLNLEGLFIFSDKKVK